MLYIRLRVELQHLMWIRQNPRFISYIARLKSSFCLSFAVRSGATCWHSIEWRLTGCAFCSREAGAYCHAHGFPHEWALHPLPLNAQNGEAGELPILIEVCYEVLDHIHRDDISDVFYILSLVIERAS